MFGVLVSNVSNYGLEELLPVRRNPEDEILKSCEWPSYLASC